MATLPEKIKLIDYYSILFPELDIKTFIENTFMDSKFASIGTNMSQEIYKQAAGPLEIPPVSEVAVKAKPNLAEQSGMDVGVPIGPPPPIMDTPLDTNKPINPMPPSPVENGAKEPEEKKENESLSEDVKIRLLSELNSLKSDIDHLKTLTTVDDVKNSIITEVKNILKDLQSDVEDFKDRKVPKRKTTDLNGAYKHQIYAIGVGVLDEILPELFEEVPEYSLLSLQVSRFFIDGTVADGLLSISCEVDKNGNRYDFLVELPILNGLIHHPIHITHNRKVIPLTSEAIQEFLLSKSYRKPYVKEVERKNLYSYNNTETHKREDKQKYYPTLSNLVGPVGVPTKSKWVNYKTIGSNTI